MSVREPVDAASKKSHREMVNKYIKKFGELVGVKFDPLDEDGYTSVTRGSATVGINVLDVQGVLLFLSQIMRVPEQKETQFALYRKLLELNFLATSDGAFAVDKDKDTIYLRALRMLDGLDFEEFVDILDTVATVADGWDDKLREMFAE